MHSFIHKTYIMKIVASLHVALYITYLFVDVEFLDLISFLSFKSCDYDVHRGLTADAADDVIIRGRWKHGETMSTSIWPHHI